MTTVYMIRHALAEGNLYRRCQGWYNGLITVKGYEQIDALERRFEGVRIDAVYSSDLFRTMTTAGAIYRPRGLELHVDPELREIGGGCWEDHAWGELLHQDPQSLLAFLRCDPDWHVDGSETFPAIRQRFHTAVERIAASHPDQTIAVVAHGSVIRAGISHWLGLPVDQMGQLALGDNTSVAKLEYENGSMKLCYYNDANHLGQLAAPSRQGDMTDKALLLDVETHSLRFRSLNLPAEQALYTAARQDGWMASHGTMNEFDGAAFLDTALRNHAYDPSSVLVAMAGNTAVGVLQMDYQQEADQGVGRIPFFYMKPEFRSRGLGVQLLGQAVSTYRALGRKYIRLRCAPENARAKKFYERHGFAKVGEEPGGIGHLDTMEKYIGCDMP